MRMIHAAFAAALLTALAPACAQEADEPQAAEAGDAAAPAAEETQLAQADADADADAGADAAMTPASDASPDAGTLGQADAPVTIIEYASTTCPHCAEFHATLFPHVKSEWIDSGRAKLIMRPLPTQPVQLAVAGFLIAHCAGNDRYFDVLGDLFESQEELFTSAQNGDLQAYYEGVAADNGVDDLEACFSDTEGLEQINASIQAAQGDQVAGTPSFVIDGQPYSAADLHSEESWDEALQTAYDAQQ